MNKVPSDWLRAARPDVMAEEELDLLVKRTLFRFGELLVRQQELRRIVRHDGSDLPDNVEASVFGLGAAIYQRGPESLLSIGK
jgi:hypothetical protein